MPDDSAVPFKSVRRNASWVVSLRIVGIVATFAGLVLATRLLGPAGFGEFTFLKSLVVLGATLGMVGLNEAGLRFISESLGLGEAGRAFGYVKRIVSTVFKASALAALLVVGGMSLYQASSSAYVAPWLLLALIATGVIVLAAQQVAAESLRAYDELRWASVFSGGQMGGPASNLLFLLGIGTAALMAQRVHLNWVVGLVVGSLVLTMPVALYALKKTARGHQSGNDQSHPLLADDRSREITRVGGVLMFNQLLVLVTCHCDIWLGKALLTENDLGHYSVAKQCLLLAAMPVQMAMMTILPIIPRYWAQQRKVDLETVLRSTATYAAVPSIIALVLLSLFPQQLLQFAFGAEYAGASSAVLVLVIGHVVLVFCGNPPHVLAMTGQQSTVVAVNLLASAVLVIIGYFAADKFGAVGLAAASSTSLAVQHGLLWWLARKKLDVWTHIGRPLRQMP